MDNGKYEINL